MEPFVGVGGRKALPPTARNVRVRLPVNAKPLRSAGWRRAFDRPQRGPGVEAARELRSGVMKRPRCTAADGARIQ
jgi:hypothetical protein